MPVNQRLLVAAQMHAANQARAQQMLAARAQQVRQVQQQRQMAPQPRGVSIGPVTARQAAPVLQRAQMRQAAGQQAAAQGNTIDWGKLIDQRDVQNGQKPSADQGGGGLLHSILGNSIVKGALKPLSIIGLPGKVVESTVKELVDLGHGRGFSGKDWLNQVKDPSFGYGKIIGDLTGNKWIDRTLGFLGDVALDPLTYLSFGGEAAVGAGGRAANAMEAAARGLEHGVTDELIAKAGQRSGAALSSAERETIGLTDKLGIKVGLPFGGPKAVIPGTEGIQRGVALARDAMRLPFADTKAAEFVSKLGVGRDPELRDAYRTLATGHAVNDIADARRAANLIRATHAGREAERYLTGKAEVEANKLGDVLAGNTAFTHDFEVGKAAGHPAGQRVAALGKFLKDAQAEHNINIGDIADAEYSGVKNYLPHIWTDEGEALLGRNAHDIPGGRATRVNNIEGEAQNFDRAFKIGKTYKIADKEFTPKIGSIQEINDWGMKEFGTKLLEDDPKYLIARMTEDATKAVGKAARTNALETGAREVYNATEPFVTKVVSKPNEARAAEVQAEMAAQENLGQGQRAAVDRLTPAIRDRVKAEVDKTLTEHTALDAEAKAALKDANSHLSDLTKSRDLVMSTADQLFDQAKTRVDAARQALDQAVTARQALQRQVRGDRRSVFANALEAQTAHENQLRKTLADTEGVARERDIARKRLGRAIESHTKVARADEATQAGLQSQLEQIAQGAEAERQAIPPEAVAAANPPAPTATAFDQGRADQIEAMAGAMDNKAAGIEKNIRDTVRSGLASPDHVQIKAKAAEAEQLRRQAQAGRAEIERMRTAAQPPPEIAADALQGPAAPDQLLDINRRQAISEQAARDEAVGSAQARAASMQRRDDLVNLKSQLDERFAQRGEARQGLTQGFDEGVQERMAPFVDEVRRKQTATDAATVAAREQHQRASDFYDAVPDAIQGDLEAIAPAMSDAEAAKALAQTNLVGTSAAVKDTKARLVRTKAIPDTPRASGKFDSYEALGDELRYVAGSDLDPTTKMMLDVHGRLTTQMAKTDADYALNQAMLKDLRDGKLDPIMERVPDDGYQFLKSSNLLNGQDKIISDTMQRAMDNYKRVARAEPGAFGKVVDAYTKFFKNWATATPGFHIRNAMAAVFMNMTEGVSFTEMLQGREIWRAFRSDPMGDWVSKLPEHLQPHAEDVVKAVYGSGAGGRYTAAELGNRAFGERQGSRFSILSDNALTQRSHNIGERVEGEVRAGLALNEIKNSGSINTATMRIKRVHFDYSDVNEWDQGLRRVIPFWTFMSRNIPLQVSQMWLKPRTYLMYEHLKNNFNVDPAGTSYMPQYLKDQGATRIAGGLIASPDVGSNQLFQAIETLGSPQELSNLNPIFKVPLQLATNQDFYYGNQYKANDFQKPGWDTALLNPLLEATGLAQKTAAGPAVERKYLDAIRDLVPVAGQLNRLGTTTSDREGTGWQALLNYIGVPLKTVPSQMPEKVLRSMQNASSRVSPEDARRNALSQFVASNS